MVFEEDEPFDSLGGNGPPPTSPAASSQLRKSSPSVPPAAAFGKSTNSSLPPPNAPPAAAFGNSPSQPSSSAPPPLVTQTQSQPPDAAVVTPKDEAKLPGNWKQYENHMDAHRSESALGVDRSMASAAEREATRRFLNEEEDKMTALPSEKQAISESDNQSEYSNYKLSSNVAGSSSNEGPGLAPRQPYSFKKSSSYDTNELIRKYGVVAGIPQAVSSSGSFGGGRSVSTEPPKPTAPATRQKETSQDVRQEALEVLAMVDDHLSSPLNVTRTRSGGYRATPFNNSSSDHGSPFDIRRSQSGGVRATPHMGDPGQQQGRPQFTRSSSSGGAYDKNGKRIPSALTGLQFSSASNRSSWKEGRYSFTDPSFREDDDNSVEDDIIKNGNSFQDEFHDEPVIDVVSLENRSMASRATSLNNNGISQNGSFDGDFPRTTPSSWSSRYSDTFANQKRILDQWDEEYDNERRTTSARKMFMSTAHNMKSAAGNAWTGAQTQSEKVFGPGFSFRKNFVFGKQSGAEKSDMNLRTAWKDIGEDEIAGSSVHKSWQEVMLSKQKRRRVLMLLGVLLLAIFVVIGVSVKSNKPGGGEPKVKANSKFGSSVTFYVTSDVPYDNDERLKLSKDLFNVPVDGDFLVHLGNIQKASETLCPWTRYANVAAVLKEAQTPVFMLPGEEDWTLCPDPTASLIDWKDSFTDFQRHFVHGLEVYHDEINSEAFAIVHDGVLFLGVHLVNGPVHDTTEWASREVQMLTFFFGMTNVHKDKFRAIVLMANARPTPQHDEFFRNVYLSLDEIKKPLLYIHANSGTGSVREYYPVDNDKSIVAVEVEDGGKNPPLKITVGYGQRPFLIG